MLFASWIVRCLGNHLNSEQIVPIIGTTIWIKDNLSAQYQASEWPFW